MAKPNLKLIRVIRKTVRKLKQNVAYQWGHMGSCNCGHLAQEMTRVSKADIHRFALYSEGSWTDQSRAYLRAEQAGCPTSGLPMDLLISAMLDYGLEIRDLEYLEKLSDPKVLKSLDFPRLRFNQKNDVILYMKAWADLLEQELLAGIALGDLERSELPDQRSQIF